MPIYHHAITRGFHHTTRWEVASNVCRFSPYPSLFPHRSYIFLALLGGKLDVAGVVFQNFLAQGCRVDVRVNLCG